MVKAKRKFFQVEKVCLYRLQGVLIVFWLSLPPEIFMQPLAGLPLAVAAIGVDEVLFGRSFLCALILSSINAKKNTFFYEV